ncbi:MAG: HDIG domain-containing protein [Thermovirga sp.]
MNRSESDGSVATLLGHFIHRLASEEEYRFRWIGTIAVVASAALLLTLAWWIKDGTSSFQTGSPAPRTYFAHSRMKILDENATRALREQRISDIGGVLVRDRSFVREVRGRLLMIERGDYSEILPGPLFEILEDLPPESRDRVVSASFRIGTKILESNELPGHDTDPIWNALKASDLSIPERNLVFQVLDHVIGQSIVLDPDATREYKSQVAADVVPVERVLSVGDTIARKGEIVSPELALVLRAQGYQERSFPLNTLIFVIFSVMLWTSWMWWYARRREFNFDPREWGYIISILLFGWIAMFVSSHFGGNGLGILTLAGWAFLGLPGSFSFQLVLWGGIIGSVITSGSSSTDLMLSVFASGMTASVGYVLMRKISSRYDLVRKLFFLGAGLSFGAFMIRWGLYLPCSWSIFFLHLISSFVWVIVALAALPVWEKFFDILTPIRLVDLTHPSHPLLKRLQVEAPGTYHHSLMVGTLAEAAAESLKMNALLLKAGASFHDVGKLRRPQFFVENQQTGRNPHDELAPTLSALIIISHVREGLETARQYGIPKKIRLFIREHHGTTCLGYFFRKAVILDPDLQMDQFCYPGNRPSSRESAVVMLADSVEAAVRAAAGDINDPMDLEEAVSEVIETKISESQLEEVPLTFQDLTKIKTAFVDTLKHMYHTRKVAPLGVDGKTEVSDAGIH